MKWYVLQVTTGKELSTLQAIKQLRLTATVPQELKLIRSGGNWEQKSSVLFPGYVFIQCNYDAQTYYKLKETPNIISWLGVGKAQAIPLTTVEAEWIHVLSNGGKPIEPTKVTYDGDTPRFDGVLAYLAGTIKKIDKHGKKATISVPILGEEKQITLSVIFDTEEDTAVDSSPVENLVDTK